MLYRAHVPLPPSIGNPPAEATVFFESPPGGDPYVRLQRLLGMVWLVAPDQIDPYNLLSEHELRAAWHDDPRRRLVDRHLCLLQIGAGPAGAEYCDIEHTHLYVGPVWHARLVGAQTQAALVQMGASRVFLPGTPAFGQTTLHRP
mgnify:CR=1 FL=1